MKASIVNCSLEKQKLYQKTFLEDQFYFIKENKLENFLLFHEIDVLIIYDEEAFTIERLQHLSSDHYQLIFYSHDYQKLYICASLFHAYYDEENDLFTITHYRQLKEEKETFHFRDGDHLIHLSCHEVSHIVHRSRLNILYTLHKTYYVSDYLFKHYLSRLEDYGFIRINCYDYLNKASIQSVDHHQITLKTGEEYSLTRTYQEKFLDWYHQLHQT